MKKQLLKQQVVCKVKINSLDNQVTSLSSNKLESSTFYDRVVAGVRLGSGDTKSLESYTAISANPIFDLNSDGYYRINYNTKEYLKLIDNPEVNKIGYDIYSTYTASTYIEGGTNYYQSLNITTGLADYQTSKSYYFHIYPNDNDYPGKWLKSSNAYPSTEKWIDPQDSFTYHASGLINPQFESILLYILTYDDNGTLRRATQDGSLVDGKVYDIDFDVNNYINIFNLLTNNQALPIINDQYGELYRDEDTNIRFYQMTDQNGLRIRMNGTYLYMNTVLGDRYPFVWKPAMDYGKYVYTDADLSSDALNKIYIDTTKIAAGQKDTLRKILKGKDTDFKEYTDNFKNWSYNSIYSAQNGSGLIDGKYYLLKNVTGFSDIDEEFKDYKFSDRGLHIYDDNKGNYITLFIDVKPNAGGTYIYFDVYQNYKGPLSNGTTFFDVTSQRNLTHSFEIVAGASSSVWRVPNTSYIPNFVYFEYKPEYVKKADLFEKLIDTTQVFDATFNTVSDAIELSYLNSKPYEDKTITLKTVPSWTDISNLYLTKNYDFYGQLVYNDFCEISTSSNVGNINIYYDKPLDAYYVKFYLDNDNKYKFYFIVSKNFTRTYSGSTTQSITKDTWYYSESENAAWTETTKPTIAINQSLIEDKFLFGTLFDYYTTLEEKISSISQFPACPTTTDGTYILEATVADGEVTYAWVLKSS